LENKRGKDDEMSREVWKIVEAEAKKTGVAETKRKEAEEGGREKKPKKKRG